ncbi:MAG: Abortive infection C-terminus [Acidimicrobiaceae bacterium]|nr:Abortive infection C-terminus [Acidimicrobiaceae bacterium]
MRELVTLREPAKFRTALRRKVKLGEELLAAIASGREVVAKHVQNTSKRLLLDEFKAIRDSMDVREPLERRVGYWERANRQMFLRFLSTGADEVYGVEVTPAWPWGKPDGEALNALETTVRIRLGELEKVRDRLGSELRRAPVRVLDLGFLRGGGRLEDDVVTSFERRLAGMRDRRNVPRGIAAAKELVEAVNDAARHAMTMTREKDSTLGKDCKQVREALLHRLSRVHPGTVDLERKAFTLTTGLNTVIDGLAQVRNDLGEGHGRRAAPKGLQLRHAGLAIEASLAYARYVFAAMEDGELI